MTRQRVEKIQPFQVRRERRALENLQHAFDLPFGDQRHDKESDKPFRLQSGSERLVFGGELDFGAPIFKFYHPPLQSRATGIVGAHAHAVILECLGPKPFPARQFQNLHLRIEQQDIGSIYAQLTGDFTEQNAKRNVQVETAGNRLINSAEGGQTLQVLLGLLIQGHAMDRVGGDIGDRG